MNHAVLWIDGLYGGAGGSLCTGKYSNQCPYDFVLPDPGINDPPFSYSAASLSEGVHHAQVTAHDVIGNTSLPGKEWDIKVDKSKPSAPVISGTMWDHRNQQTDHRNEGLYDPTFTLNASSGDTYSGLKSIDVQVDTGTPMHYVAACSGSDGCSDTYRINGTTSDYADGDHTITVTAKDQLADRPGVNNANHTSTTTFTVTIDRNGDIYHATDWEGDPTTADTDGEEYAQINTQNMRHVDHSTLVTRNLVTCLNDAQGCAQERSQTRFVQDDPAATDDYTTTTGTSHDDARLRDDSELLAPANSGLGPPTSSGPITDALELWQQPPPAHGTTYLLYTITDPTVTDGQQEDEVKKLWLDSATMMPLRRQVSSGASVESDVYYSYDKGRLTSGEVAPDFFAAPAPANLGQTDSVLLPVVDLPLPADDPDPTDEEQIADAQAFRTDFGLQADYAYVKSLFDDPTLDNSADAYGVPLTAAETANLDARAAAEDDLGVVDDYGANQAAGSYAGTYVDQSNGGAIYVGFTQNVTANMDAIKAIYPHPELLHPYPTTPARTVQQLDALQAQVEADIDNGTLAGLHIDTTGQDEELNQVVVTSAAPTAADQALLTARYGNGVSIQQQTTSDADSAANHRTPPNIGGLKINSTQKFNGSTFAFSCTSGFGAVKKYNTNGHKGREYFDVSAGHCLASTGEAGNSKHGYGLRWHHNGKPLYGITITNTLVPAGRTTNSDALSIQVSPETHSNKIYVRTGKNATPHLRRITDSVTHYGKGRLVCHSGYRTKREYCGRTTRLKVRFRQGNGTKVTGITEVKLSSCGVDHGDSGGPVYRGHKAFGILKGESANRNCPGTRGNFFTFTKIGAGLHDLGGLELLK
jgi:hypothetical protein